ncbi:hypothetical protein IID04_05360 [PVC group bacterium]|nr:hypothetical protein [PVC group bacterium]
MLRKKMNFSLLNERGVSFIEIMISLTILMMVGVSALKAFTLGTEITKINSQKIVAMQFAQDRIEEIKEDDYTNVITANYPLDVVTLDTSNSINNTADDLVAQRTVAIVNNGNTKDITVTVTWTSQAKTYSEIIRTIIGE